MNALKDICIVRMHEIIMNIMCDINDFCLKNNLTYFLSGGSCLGAIRHHGFIPWDHDGDIMMPREDYEFFVSNFGNAYTDKYKVGSLQTEKEWARPYAKVWDINTSLKETKTNEMVRGVAVDVFPIDGLPSDTKKRKRYYKKTRVLSELRKNAVRKEFFDVEKYRFIRSVLSVVLRPIGGRFFAQELENSAKQYDYQTSEYVGVSMACHYWEKETIEKKYMDEQIWVSFENKQFPVPKGYDKYLTNLYGDYMQVPSKVVDVEKRIMDAWELELDVNGKGQSDKCLF